MITQLLYRLKTVAAAIKKSESININNATLKQEVISVGAYYFKECRTDVNRILNDKKALAEFDEGWQRLIRLAHGNNNKRSYDILLKQLLKKTKELSVANYASAPTLDDISL